MSRRADDSEIVYAGKDRFLSRTVGGAIKVDGKAREPARAFAGRGGQRLTKEGRLPNELPQRTEDSVELGLDFLARHQSADGSWSFNRFGAGQPGYEHEEASFQSDTAATGLALLAFLGAGYDHYDDQYLNVVRGGLDFLVNNQKPNGDLYLATDAESNKSALVLQPRDRFDRPVRSLRHDRRRKAQGGRPKGHRFHRRLATPNARRLALTLRSSMPTRRSAAGN